jgi:hypothetical protein
VKGFGAAFILVYLPTKPEVYLLYVERDDGLLYRTAYIDVADPTELLGQSETLFDEYTYK